MKYTTFEIEIKSLNRMATAYVYLPKSYDGVKRFPVLYMNDANNLFDDQLATYGNSWKIIEAFENDPSIPEMIVCGVNCADGMSRFDEYSPFVDKTLQIDYAEFINRDVGGLGDTYLDFMTKEFKPLIDEKYMTKPEQVHTGLMGSSMGGLISVYAAYKYSDTFSRIGAVSTAYFFAKDEMFAFMRNNPINNIIKMYADCGDNEQSGETATNEVYLKTNEEAAQILSSKLAGKYKYHVIEGGIHSETSWSTRVGEIIKYLYSDIEG